MESMSFKNINIEVIDRDGSLKKSLIEVDIEDNLMEILKAGNYEMRATCGGMGLCADCHCEILSGMDHFPPPTDQEYETLDTLPIIFNNSRLACQIKKGDYLSNTKIRLINPS